MAQRRRKASKGENIQHVANRRLTQYHKCYLYIVLAFAVLTAFQVESKVVSKVNFQLCAYQLLAMLYIWFPATVFFIIGFHSVSSSQ